MAGATCRCGDVGQRKEVENALEKITGQQAAVMLQTEDEAATEEEAPLEDM
jgi:hypothetical protein